MNPVTNPYAPGAGQRPPATSSTWLPSNLDMASNGCALLLPRKIPDSTDRFLPTCSEPLTAFPEPTSTSTTPNSFVCRSW